MKRFAQGLVLLGCVAATAAQAQTTGGYYRTCKNYNPDFQEVYDNVDSGDHNKKSAALTQYIRDTGCRKQVIRAIDIVRDEKKQCEVPRHPDYDTYQRTIINLLSQKELQENQALMNTPIEMVAPEFMRQLLKCR